ETSGTPTGICRRRQSCWPWPADVWPFVQQRRLLMPSAPKSFSQLVQSFFCQRLQLQQRVSGHTLASYRDTFRLGVQFIKQQTGREASRQRLEDWDAVNVLA